LIGAEGRIENQLFLTVGVAALGGFCLSFINLWEDSKKGKAERVPKDVLYWSFWIIWPLIGALLSFVYYLDGSTLRPFASFTLGIGAPATLKALMNTASLPNAPPTNTD
jgi:hypothetical protein